MFLPCVLDQFKWLLMKITRIVLLSLLMLIVLATITSAADWLNAPSYYSHNPKTGNPTAQYTPTPDVYIYQDPTYQRSGYRNTRSSIRVNGSADNFHLVEEWGRPIRPYGEWQRPYRPYSVPYSQWGEPFRGLGPIYNGYPQYPYPSLRPPIHRPHLPGRP